MTPRLSAAAILLLVAAGPAFAQDEESPVARARAAAETWLAIVDGEEYGRSWDAAAALFQQAIARAAWDSTMRAVRQPMGTVRTGAFLGAQHTTDLPNAPPGEYVIVQFSTTFEHRPQSVETVVPMKEPDGGWKVSGYFIR